MKKFRITYRIGRHIHSVKVDGFDRAQDQVALVMNAGGEILGIKEEKR